MAYTAGLEGRARAREAPRRLVRWLPILLLAAGAVVAATLLGDALGIETLRANHADLLAWRDRSGPTVALAMLAAHVAVVALSLPGAFVLGVAAGALFGLVTGTILVVLGGSIGAALVFLAARAGPGDAARAHLLADADGRFARLDRALRANAVGALLLLLRLVPVVPFAVANVVPAFLGVRLRLFLATTLVGIAPGSALTVWIGVGLGEVLAAGGEPGVSLMLAPSVIVPTAALYALAALPLLAVARRRRGRL